MDMSVKLNPSYPASAPVETPSSKRPDSRQPVVAATETDRPAADRTTLEQAVTAIQDYVKASERQLDFSIDDSTGQVVVKVIARQSGEIIRQLPSEEALKLAQRLEDANSLLFDMQV